MSVPGYLDYIELNRTFAAVAATRNRSVNLSGGGDPVRLIGLGVTANFFETIGVSPQVGRTFVAQEDQPNADTVAVLSHGLWERQFAADPAVVGQRVLLDGRAHDVIGVLPASFVFPGEIDIYLPAAFTPQERENRGGEFLSVVARLRSDVSLSEAQSDMARISRLLQPQFYAFDDRWHLIVEPFQDTLVEEVRPAVLVLTVAVGLVLLVGCLNVANLLVARGWARRTELAVRAALGAGRSRVVRQLVTESLVLALLAGVVGCAIAAGMVPVLVSALPDGMAFQQVVVDGRVLGFALFVSVVTGLLFGTLPALHAAQLEPQNILRGGRGASTRTGRTRSVLVTAEIAVAVVLIVGTGLLARSFLMLQRVEPGFRATQVLTMRVALPANRYPEPTQQTALYRRILDGLRSVPAITEAGAISVLPLSQQTLNSSFAIEGIPILEDEAAPHGDPRAATPGYFAAMGIDVLRGQLYGNVDEAAPPVVVIDEEMVRRYFVDDDPIGRRIAFFFEGSPDAPHWREIVGVVRNVKHDGLDRDPRMQIYYPYRQRPQGAMFLAVRTVGDPTAVQALVREVVRRADAQLPLYDVRTMNERLAASLGPRRYTASVMVAFGLTALLMAGIGTYGVMAYLVSTTTRELGIRIALGAKPSQVAGLVLGRGLALTGAGVMLGVVSALALSRLLSSVLFGIASTDPLTFGAAVVVVFSVATVACWLPARRATRVDPVAALRAE